MLGLGTLSRVVGEVRRDVAAAQARDPAARGAGSSEILTQWPGVQALLLHRVAHGMYTVGVPFVPRTISMVSRTMTGIEIHPAAEIGQGFFIDHGAGVVIGETAQIGDDVTLFQGVTLGGTGFATGKRHPTLEDNVTVGAGAKLLGAITVGLTALTLALVEASAWGWGSPRILGLFALSAIGLAAFAASSSTTSRRTPRSSATRAIRCASTAAGPKGPTSTGSICQTRSPTRSKAWPRASTSSSASSPRRRAPRARPRPKYTSCGP